MIIACDVDGVVADLHAEWLRRYNRDHNDTLTLDAWTQYYIHHHVKESAREEIYGYLHDADLYTDVKPIPGALEGVRALRGMGHDVLFVTSCTWGMTDQKAQWLIREGFLTQRGDGMLPDGLLSTNDKTVVDAQLLIDDNAGHVRPWVNSRRRYALLMAKPWNESIIDEVPSAFWAWCARVRDWPAVIKAVAQRDA